MPYSDTNIVFKATLWASTAGAGTAKTRNLVCCLSRLEDNGGSQQAPNRVVLLNRAILWSQKAGERAGKMAALVI